MKYNAVYYFADSRAAGECYCVGCLPAGVDVDSEGVYPIFSSDESDSYPVCCVCGREHDYIGLTDYGRAEEATRESVAV